MLKVISSRLLQKYALMAIGSLVIFLVLGFIFSDWLLHSVGSQFFQDKNIKQSSPLALARVLGKLSESERIQFINDWQDSEGDRALIQLVLLNEKAEVLAPTAEVVKINLHPYKKIMAQPWSSNAVEIRSVQDLDGFSGRPPGMMPMPPPELMGHRGGPPELGSGPPPLPPGEPPMGPPPGGFGPPGPMGSQWLAHLPGAQNANFLVLRDIRFDNFPRLHPPKYFPIIGLVSLVLSLIIGVGVATFFIYNSVHQQVKIADQVLGELQKGNFRARFPIHRKDEFGQAMMRFNKMADEIENLVLQLRQVEQARNRMLQELAHDLRTPIASLRSMLETSLQRSANLTPEVRHELLSMALRDTLYFEKLVEDLLFLSQVSEPKYHLQTEELDLQSLVKEVVHDAESLARSKNKTVRIVQVENLQVRTLGDNHLVRRVIWNAVQNALDFAKSEVVVRVDVEQGRAIVCVEDNGNGFRAADIEAFGVRRTTRSMQAQTGDRMSVGLGSVIMRTVCQLHGGNVRAENRQGAAGETLGARVVLQFGKV